MIALLLRLTLAGVLGYAGVSKLPHAWNFAETIANYQIFPAQANQLAAVIMPWCEVLVGILLLCGVWVRPAAMLGALLFAGFTIAVVSAMARGLDIECGCFGTETASKAGAIALTIDLAGLAVSLLLAWIAVEHWHSARPVVIDKASDLTSQTLA